MPPSITIQTNIHDAATSSMADSDATATLGTRSSVTLSNDSASTSRLSNESSSGSDDSSTSEEDSNDEDDEISADHLSSLLQKARSAARSNAAKLHSDEVGFEEQDHIKIGKDEPLPNLPSLNLSSLPTLYTTSSKGKGKGSASYRNLDTEAIIRYAVDTSAPAPPDPPRTKLGKKERQALKAKTAGAGWFDLPAPAEADLPRLYREVEALRLRNQLDPKRFYRKDEGEGKGVKGLPKHFAIGTIIATRSPFAPGATKDGSTRKRTLVDELVDDAEARAYAKKKFKDLQADRGARGKGTLAKRKQGRREKW